MNFDVPRTKEWNFDWFVVYAYRESVRVRACACVCIYMDLHACALGYIAHKHTQEISECWCLPHIGRACMFSICTNIRIYHIYLRIMHIGASMYFDLLYSNTCVTCVYIYTYTYIYLYKYVYIYIYMYVYICTHTCMKLKCATTANAS